MVKLSKSHSPVHLSLRLRFRFASNPLLNRSLEWEKKGTYMGFARELHRRKKLLGTLQQKHDRKKGSGFI